LHLCELRVELDVGFGREGFGDDSSCFINLVFLLVSNEFVSLFCLQLSELLGSGAFKSVYKAIDRDRGIEVAWNQLRLDRFQVFYSQNQQQQKVSFIRLSAIYSSVSKRGFLVMDS